MDQSQSNLPPKGAFGPSSHNHAHAQKRGSSITPNASHPHKVAKGAKDAQCAKRAHSEGPPPSLRMQEYVRRGLITTNSWTADQRIRTLIPNHTVEVGAGGHGDHGMGRDSRGFSSRSSSGPNALIGGEPTPKKPRVSWNNRGHITPSANTGERRVQLSMHTARPPEQGEL